MTNLTAIEFISNYPENILVEYPQNEEGRFAFYVYRTKGKQIHKLMFNTEPEWDSKKEAKEYFKEMVSEIRNALEKNGWLKNNNV